MSSYEWPSQAAGNNASVGNNNQAAPTSSTQIGGSDGTDLRPIAVDASGNIKVVQSGSNWSTNIAEVGGSAIAIGQAAMAASMPVAIASNQSAIPASQSGSWAVTANAGTNLNTSALALDTSVNGILLAQSSATASEKGPMVQGAVTTSAPTYVTGNTNPLSLTTAGALRVDASGSTQPVSGTVTANQGTANATPWNENIAQFGGSAVVTGVGASGIGIPRVTVSNDSNILASQSGTWTVQPGNTPNTTPWLVKESTYSAVNHARNDYAVTPVTTSAYVQIIASTSAACSWVEIFDSSGQTLILATGGSGSEVDQIYITPGGNGRVPLSIASATRISVKAVSANATTGELDLNLYG